MNRFSEDRESSCCFSGHRALTPQEMEKAALKITELLPGFIAEGITHFYAGGALGFDLAASVTVVNHKQTYPGIKLTLALPCRNHMVRWRRIDAELFRRVISVPTRWFMSARNIPAAVCSFAIGIWLTEVLSVYAGLRRKAEEPSIRFLMRKNRG